jgi:DNA excision repair protein ERCC-4
MARNESESVIASGPIAIVMDDCEPRDLMSHEIAASGCFALEIRHLSVGDYLIDDALLIERKTLPDLVQSIIDGRLFQQALRLVEAKYPAALILEGSALDLHASGMRWEAIQGALVTVTLFMGLPVLRSRCPEETVRIFIYAAQQRRVVNADALTRHSRRPKRKAALQSYILQGLPGVGPKRAKQLIDRFGSVEAVFRAGTDALAEMEGFGPGTVRKIRCAVEEPRVRSPAYAPRRV